LHARFLARHVKRSADPAGRDQVHRLLLETVHPGHRFGSVEVTLNGVKRSKEVYPVGQPLGGHPGGQF
jgi:hypothetical protein